MLGPSWSRRLFGVGAPSFGMDPQTSPCARAAQGCWGRGEAGAQRGQESPGKASGRVRDARGERQLPGRYQPKIQNSTWIEGVGGQVWGRVQQHSAPELGALVLHQHPPLKALPEGTTTRPPTPPCKPATGWLLIPGARNSCELFGILSGSSM